MSVLETGITTIHCTIGKPMVKKKFQHVVTVLFCAVEARGGEPCDGCGGRGTGGGAGEAKSRGAFLHLGLTHVQVAAE